MSFAAVCGTGHAPDGEFEKLDAAWGMDVVWPMIECCDEEGGCGRVFNKFECSLQAAILKNPEIGALRVYTRAASEPAHFPTMQHTKNHAIVRSCHIVYAPTALSCRTC